MRRDRDITILFLDLLAQGSSIDGCAFTHAGLPSSWSLSEFSPYSALPYDNR
jgi:hypothetical protein